MLLTSKDLAVLKQSREYIDTAVLLCNIFSFKDQLEESVVGKNYLDRLGAVLEKEYKGRVLLCPSLQFTSVNEATLASIDSWKAELKEFGFKYIMIITTDLELKEKMESEDDIVIWLPAFSVDDNDSHTDAMITSQIRNIMKSLYNKWTLTE